MRPFRAISIVKHPPHVVARVVRDRLPELASFLEDVDEVEVVEREALADGSVRQVNTWRASTKLAPAVLATLGGPVEWLDEALWRADASVCAFKIEPLFLQGAIQCEGTATYQPAMGGKGTRATFEGAFGFQAAGGASVAGLDRLIASTVEFAAISLIPKNLRRTLEAAAALLDRDAPA